MSLHESPMVARWFEASGLSCLWAEEVRPRRPPRGLLRRPPPTPRPRRPDDHEAAGDHQRRPSPSRRMRADHRPVGDTIGPGVVITGAAEAPPNPYGDHQDRWYYSTADGATWVASIPPDNSDGGLVLPINAKARAASEAGVDVPEDAPAFDGIGDAFPAADLSRTCTRG